MNKELIEFPSSTRAWGEITYISLCGENNSLLWGILKKVFKIKPPYKVIYIWKKDE